MKLSLIIFFEILKNECYKQMLSKHIFKKETYLKIFFYLFLNNILFKTKILNFKFVKIL